MAFVTVKVVDKNGVLCPRADHSISYEVEGPAEIVGLCNGDATSVESFKGTQMKVFNGMAVVYLRSVDGGDGDITLKAETEGLPVAITKLNTTMDSKGKFDDEAHDSSCM
jgi:beta-galactosidase